MSISLFVQILGWMASVVLAFLLGNVLRPFLNSYSNEKGKNLATKEDIAQLTKIAEGIKAKISDEYWDRQEQWKLRRDAVIEVHQALGELEDALGSLHSVHSCQVPENEDSNEYLRGRLDDELISFDVCNRRFNRAMFKARLVAGKELHHALTECSEEIRSVSRRILNEETAYITRSVPDASPHNVVKIDFETLIQKMMQAILSERKSLGIELTE